MKTKFIQLFAFSIVLIMTGADAYAADGGRAAAVSGATTLTIGAGDLSFTTNVGKNVGLQYNSTGGSTYNAGSLHIAGSREFATGDSSPSLWWDGCTLTPCGTQVISGASASAVPDFSAGGWTSM